MLCGSQGGGQECEASGVQLAAGRTCRTGTPLMEAATSAAEPGGKGKTRNQGMAAGESAAPPSHCRLRLALPVHSTYVSTTLTWPGDSWMDSVWPLLPRYRSFTHSLRRADQVMEQAPRVNSTLRSPLERSGRALEEAPHLATSSAPRKKL